MNNINDIAKERFKVNDNESSKTSDYKAKDSTTVELIAQRLVEKFHSDGSWEFYCLVAWRLPEPVINQLIESAWRRGIRNHGAYFNTSASNELRKHGYNAKNTARFKAIK
jgi:hypothetical protein